jgi:hypothetical protein
MKRKSITNVGAHKCKFCNKLIKHNNFSRHLKTNHGVTASLKYKKRLLICQICYAGLNKNNLRQHQLICKQIKVMKSFNENNYTFTLRHLNSFAFFEDH